MLVIMLFAACEPTSFIGVWENNQDVTMEITNEDPYKIEYEGDEETYYFTEFDHGVSDDGTFDFILLDNRYDVHVGLRLPHDSFDRIEFLGFDSQGEIVIEDIFHRQ